MQYFPFSLLQLLYGPLHNRCSLLRLPLFSPALIGFPLPHTIHVFFPLLFPQPLTPLLVQCPVSTGAFEQFEIKANNGQALPGTSRSLYYTENARVLLRIIGKSLRFSGNRERELAQRNRWCKQQLSAWNSMCVLEHPWQQHEELSKQNCILTRRYMQHDIGISKPISFQG